MEKEITIAGKKIFYRVIGEGKPVMLVHGFGETGEVWKMQIGPPQTPVRPGHPGGPPKEGLSTEHTSETTVNLTSKFMFIVPDLPGSGKSEMIDDMSMEGMAEVLKQILEKELPKLPGSSKAPSPGGGLGEVCLLGHSMGGYVTLAFVEKYERYLRSFGLLHSTAFADSEEKKATRRKGIGFIQEHGAFEFFKTSTPNLFSSQTKEHSPDLVSEFVQSLSGYSSTAAIAYYESMIKRPDRTAVLKTTKLPVLFIMGEHDVAIPINDGLKLCKLPEKAYFHVLHQSGHMGMLEESEKTNRLLEVFLSEV
jgi:pimeloyl-ACP methyl ester carboxylesterase